MHKFSNVGDEWYIGSSVISNHDELAPGNYTIAFDPRKGPYFKQAAPFPPMKVYGDATARAERIMHTFTDRGRNTGVLACGDKGTGKTLLVRLVSQMAIAKGMPVLFVDQPFGGSGFNTFLSEITQPCVIIFDEFEKTYRGSDDDISNDDDDDAGTPKANRSQQSLLTLLDGLYQSNKLFLLTANDEYKIDKMFLSRPGRIFYHFKYGPLEEAFIREYCVDQLADQSKLPGVLAAAAVYGNFTFDVLRSLVEEMNRYGEPAAAVLRILNAEPTWDHASYYSFSFTYKGKAVAKNRIMEIRSRCSPHRSELNFRVGNPEDRKVKVGNWGTYEQITINPSHLVGVRGGGDEILYRSGHYEITGVRDKPIEFSPTDMIAYGYDEGTEHYPSAARPAAPARKRSRKPAAVAAE